MQLRPFAWSGCETFWLLFYAVATWGNAASCAARYADICATTRACSHCLCDRDTPLIGDDAKRGEPRGALA
ncbi:hypothetical protein ACFQGW_04470 [Xanthomonas theicola]|uniref:hypothetical protein n=1 Tax=Xanthomonas theicola TaxID=56464 RepID=UPI003622D41D